MQQVMTRTFIAGLCFHAYQQVRAVQTCVRTTSDPHLHPESHLCLFDNRNALYPRDLCPVVMCPWQVSYMILERVSPVTHSVGNCVKRIIVIVSSVIFFRTPVSQLNAIGECSHTGKRARGGACGAILMRVLGGKMWTSRALSHLPLGKTHLCCLLGGPRADPRLFYVYTLLSCETQKMPTYDF